MIGVILCGGQSSRMGSDKGLLKLEANTWAQTAVDKLEALNIPVKLSVNKKQVEDYTAVFTAQRLIADNENLPINGPLLGVLSTHLQYLTEDIFLLACDMPLMEPFLLKELYGHFEMNDNYDAFVFTNDGETEPLCGIYRANALASIMVLHKAGLLLKHSMKFMLQQLKVFSLPLKEEQKKYFRNFNAHAQLNGL